MYRRRDDFNQLMRWRRNVFVTLSTGESALICATNNLLFVRLGEWIGGAFVSKMVMTWARDDSVFDGHGWNINELNKVVAALERGKREDQLSIDLSDYKAFGSFAPLYTDAKKAIFETLENPAKAHRALSVLDGIAQMCSPTGVFFGGVRGIMERSHRSENSVKTALRFFYQLDWIRVFWVTIPHTHETLRRYILSPHVLWISRDFIAEALELWEGAESLDSFRNNSLNGQPESESRVTSRFSTQNHNQNHNHHHHHLTPQNGWDGETPPPDVESENREGKDRKTDKESESESAQSAESESARSAKQTARSAKKKPPPSSAPPPPRRTLKKYWQPLESAAAEAVAAAILEIAEQRGGGTRISQARELVDVYGVERVKTGVAWISHAIENEDGGTPIRSAMGLLTSWLRGDVVATDNAPPPQQNKYISGKFAEFIDH